MPVLPRLNGDQIKALRRAQRMTQAEFGAIFNVSRRTVAAWENDEWRAPADLMERFTESAIDRAQQKTKTTAKDRATLEAYRDMRGGHNNFTHSDIIALWSKHGFTPSREAQILILEAYPEIAATTKQGE